MIRLLLFAIAVLVAALCIQGARFAHARSGEIRSGFTADSLQAARDTTRQLAFAQLHDSVTRFTRRAAQQEQGGDALDRALQASRLATLNAQVGVSALGTVDPKMAHLRRSRLEHECRWGRYPLPTVLYRLTDAKRLQFSPNIKRERGSPSATAVVPWP
jgi:hypothetical protein